MNTKFSKSCLLYKINTTLSHLLFLEVYEDISKQVPKQVPKQVFKQVFKQVYKQVYTQLLNRFKIGLFKVFLYSIFKGVLAGITSF